MLMPPGDVWALARLRSVEADDVDLGAVSETFRPLASYLFRLPLVGRQEAWDAFMSGRPDQDAILKAIFDIDPSARVPEAEEPERWATAADFRRLMAESRWAWEGWIAADGIMGVAGFEGTGKTRFALDLCRRIHAGESWPDGQAATFAPGTRTVWLCADGHHGELVETMAAFGLPDEAVLFPSLASDPYGGTDLDVDETITALEEVIKAHRPGLVIIDTLTSATGKDLCSQAVMKGLKAPLVALCQTYGVIVMLLLHVSKEGQALGRRIKGVTRTLIHLECPDSEKFPARLRAWVEKSFAKKPPALGVTMGDAGNEYDFNPPVAPQPSKGGRPPAERAKAVTFILDALNRKNDLKATALCEEFVSGGHGKKTAFWDGRDELVTDARMVCDGQPLVLHLTAQATCPDATN